MQYANIKYFIYASKTDSDVVLVIFVCSLEHFTIPKWE